MPSHSFAETISKRVPYAALSAAEGWADGCGAESSRNARRLGPRTGMRGWVQQARKSPGGPGLFVLASYTCNVSILSPTATNTIEIRNGNPNITETNTQNLTGFPLFNMGAPQA